MIVEFTGCSGVGKTSLLRRVGEMLRRDQIPVAYPYEHFLRNRFPQSLSDRCAASTSAANLAVELLGWPSMLLGRRRFHKCDTWVRAQIRNVANSRREWLRLTRSWNRKIAVMTCGASASSELDSTILLHDEGTVHFAATLLARSTAPIGEMLDRYLDLILLPARIICVHATAECSARRLLQRRYGPAPDRHGVAHGRFLQRAREVIQRISEHPSTAPRLVLVDNESNAPSALDGLARTVVRQLATDVAFHVRARRVPASTRVQRIITNCSNSSSEALVASAFPRT